MAWATWLNSDSKEWRTGFSYILEIWPAVLNKNNSNSVTSNAVGVPPQWLIQATLFLTLIMLMIKQFFIKGLPKSKTKTQPKLARSLFDLAKLSYRPEACDLLIKILTDLKHFDVNQMMPGPTADDKMTLFLCACISGNERILRFMLYHGAEIRSRTKWADTPLHLITFAHTSSKNRHFGAIGVLIEAGCDINSRNWIGNTPLSIAASHSNINLIKYLLEKGANPSIANNKGIYPIDFANNADNQDAAALLRFDVRNPYVWDVIEPHTPPKIKLGLQSPSKQHLIDSTFTRRPKKKDKHDVN